MKSRLTIKREHEIRQALRNSTQVVAWYAHANDVRGPFNRWFYCTPSIMGDNQNPNLSTIEEDVKYCAIAMNSVPELLDEISALRELNDQLMERVTAVAKTVCSDGSWLESERCYNFLEGLKKEPT